MNAISQRPATPAELDMAAEVIIPQAELQRLYAARAAERAREERRQRRATLARNGTIFAQWGVIAALSIGAASMLPLVRVEPVFVYVRDDGTAITSKTWAELPSSARDRNILNVLSNYVTLREGWSSGQAQEAWDTVSALSSRVVKEQFQAWYRRDNPESPQRQYGERTTVRVEVTDVHKDPITPGAYRVHFRRIERAGATDSRAVPMVARLRIRDLENPSRLPWWQRVQFNGPAIQVIEYPGAVPATPHGGS